MRSYYPTGNAIARALASLRHERFSTFAWKLASGLGYRRVLRLERSLDEPIPDITPTLPIAYGQLGDDGIDDYVAARPTADRAQVASYLRAGRECHLVRVDGRIVSSCWATTSTSWSAYLGREITLADGDVYFTDAWTDPAWRGRGLAHALCVHQLRHFRALGYRRAIRGTVPENHSALRTHAKSGFRPTALNACLRIGRWHRTLDRPWHGR